MKKLSLMGTLLAVMVFTPSVTWAEEAGKQDFLTHCSSCHGVDAKGKGPMHLATKTKPTDLTMLSQAHGGNFPYIQVRRVIDGRIEKGNSSSHLNGSMPVWGDVFVAAKGHSVTGNISGEAEAKMRILNLVDYLVSIQEQCTGDCK